MANKNSQINVESETFNHPMIVAAGWREDNSPAGASPVFFTVTNKAGLLSMAYDGHFGEMLKDSDTKEIVGFPESYNRVARAFRGDNEVVAEDGSKKPTLLIVESMKEDGKTAPSRVYQAEVVAPVKEGEPSSLKIIGSINLRDGTPAQIIEDGPTIKLDSQGRLSKEEATKLRKEIDSMQHQIASNGKPMDDAMLNALKLARSDYEPKRDDQSAGVIPPSGLPTMALGNGKSGGVAA